MANPEMTPDLRLPRASKAGTPATIAVATLLVVAVIALAVAFGRGDGGDDGSGVTTGTTSTETTATTAGSTTVTSGPSSSVPAVVDTSTAVWPSGPGAVGYADPRTAARTFAAEFAGMRSPVVGPFMAGDGRSGEVEVRAARDLPVTTVFVRQLSGSDTWWVLGAATADIDVTEPQTGATVRSPIRLAGRAWAFEGHVNVEVRQDGDVRPIGTGFVLGRGDEMGPFAGQIAFAGARSPYGALVFFTDSAADGSVMAVSTVRIRFEPTTVPASCAPPAVPPPGAGQRSTTVFFSCTRDGEPGPVVAVRRNVPASAGVLRTALDALVLGPSSDERAVGLTSWFSSRTAESVRRVTLDDRGAATVDLADLRAAIPGASTSTGSKMLLEQLDATVFQFATVTSVTYRMEGSCETFFEWLQMACQTRSRPS